MLRIITDSTCNLPDEIIQRHDIRVAPITIQFGDETYEEGVDIDGDMFYRKIEETGRIPTSSQPSPAVFQRYYEEIAGRGDSSLVITVTRAHSGTYDSAMMARSMTPGADVEVFDSKTISLGTGWLVIEAARAIEEGLDSSQVIARLETIRGKLRLYFTPETLRFLQMSGRVSKLQGALGSLLAVKPIITINDGVLEAGENVRTRAKSLRRLIEKLVTALGTEAPVHLAVMHARADDEAQELLGRAKSEFNVRDYMVGELALSLAVHGGPGVIGIFGYQIQ
jgi:DegV family protein with EDD domain